MSGLVFEKLSQILSVGQVWRLAIAADFFRIAAAEWPVKVRIMKAGRILGEMDGWQAGDFVRDVEFDAVEIEAGSIAQEVTVQIAGGGVGSDRVLGEVSVIDGERSKVRSNAVFISSNTAMGGVGTYAGAVLENPYGSGCECVITAIFLTHGAAGVMGVSLRDQIPAAGVMAGNQPQNKNRSAPGVKSKTKAMVLNEAAFIGGTTLFSMVETPNQLIQIPMKMPIIVGEGGRVGITAWSQNSPIYATFEFEEVKK